MPAATEQIHNTTIVIDGRSYDINCPPEKVAELQNSANYLDKKIREVRDARGNVLSTERIAIITALNMAHELLEHKQQIEASLAAMDRYFEKTTANEE